MNKILEILEKIKEYKTHILLGFIILLPLIIFYVQLIVLSDSSEVETNTSKKEVVYNVRSDDEKYNSREEALLNLLNLPEKYYKYNKNDYSKIKETAINDLDTSFNYFIGLSDISQIKIDINNKFVPSSLFDQQTLYTLIKEEFKVIKNTVELYYNQEEDTYIVVFDIENNDKNKFTYLSIYYIETNQYEIIGNYGSFMQVFGGK